MIYITTKNDSYCEVNLFTVSAWVLIYLGVCGIIPTAIDIIIRDSVNIEISNLINLSLISFLNAIFIYSLIKKYKIKPNLLNNLSLINVLLSISLSLLFFIILDKCLDPFFDSLFTQSAIEYHASIESLKISPIISFIQICLVAPIAEETFMRGCILNCLKSKGIVIALLVSSILFAILHFNFVQTISALICGFALGLLYIKTDCLLCCILTHFLYNTISFFTTVI